MVIDTVVRSPAHFLDVIETIREDWGGSHWWRGQGAASWELLPKLCRDGSHNQEQDMIATFVLKAAYIEPRSPPLTEYAMWRFFAQHHGVPTRLLDWSSSAIIAAWFACAPGSQRDKDGAVWCLDPWRLNDAKHGIRTQFIYINAVPLPVVSLFEDPIVSTGGEERVAAIACRAGAPRMLAQHAAFTVHATLCPLELHADAEKYLRKFTIPADLKSRFLNVLSDCGISPGTLFPDLDNLGKTVAQSHWAPA